MNIQARCKYMRPMGILANLIWFAVVIVHSYSDYSMA